MSKSNYMSIVFLKYILKNPLRSLSVTEEKLASHSVCLQARRLAVARCEDGFCLAAMTTRESECSEGW